MYATNDIQIRDAVVGMLSAGVAAVSGRVFGGRVYPLSSTDLPCVLVSGMHESLDYKDADYPRTIERTLTLAVRVIGQTTGDVELEVKAVAQAVEAVLQSDPQITTLVYDSKITDIATKLEGDGESPQAVVTINDEIVYYTKEFADPVAPSTPLTDIRVGVAPDIGLGHEPDYTKL